MDFASDHLSRRSGWRRPFELWLDGIEPGWAIPVLLAGFVAIWTVFFSIAYINAGLHPDVLEAWSVGRGFPWGNAKHPPLMGWITNAWSTVFPLTDWSFNLLATVNAAVALWSVDLIVRRFLRGDRRVIVLLLLMLLPAYQFHAQRFNANSVLLAVWPLATFCFLRSFETRATLWSIATGALCALAMLGKYYSIFLIVGFAFAAILHPRRMSYLRSSAPWLSMIAGFVVLAPHLYWLATNHMASFGYAMQVHGGEPFWMSVRDVLGFWGGVCGYLAIPAVAWLLMIKSRVRQSPSDIAQADSGLKLLALVFLGSILFPPVTALALGTNLPSLWHLQGLFLVVIVAVCSIRFPVARFDTVNLAVTVIIFCVVALIAAPIHALYRNKEEFKEGRNYFHQAAEVLTKNWKDDYGAPLPRISGDDGLAFATAFYSPDHPLYSRPFQFQGQWGMPRNATLDRGWSALCFADDADCMRWMDNVGNRTEREIRFEFVVKTSLWGVPGVSRTIAAMMVPPAKGYESAEPPKKINDEGIEDLSANRRKSHGSFVHHAVNQDDFANGDVVQITQTP